MSACLETCPTCIGSGYSNHPDSGEICQNCMGSGGSKPRVRIKAPSVRITWTQYALNYMDPRPSPSVSRPTREAPHE